MKMVWLLRTESPVSRGQRMVQVVVRVRGLVTCTVQCTIYSTVQGLVTVLENSITGTIMAADSSQVQAVTTRQMAGVRRLGAEIGWHTATYLTQLHYRYTLLAAILLESF